jgi:CubicO group peptidase (beta-lactamase class C family)
MIPVGRYLPGVMPAGGKITIRELAASQPLLFAPGNQ